MRPYRDGQFFILGYHFVRVHALFFNVYLFDFENTPLPLLVFSENACTAFEGYEVPAVTSLGYNVCVPSINFLVVRAGVDKAEIDGFYNVLLAYRETESFKTAAAAVNYTSDATNADDLAVEIQNVAAICEEIFNKNY